MLGRKVEIAGAELFEHPFNLVDGRSPPGGPAATAMAIPSAPLGSCGECRSLIPNSCAASKQLTFPVRYRPMASTIRASEPSEPPATFDLSGLKTDKSSAT